MKSLSLSLSEMLSEQGFIKKDDIEVCSYGFQVFFTSFLEIASVLLISVFLKNFIPTVLFFLAFIPLRIYSGGYHADTKLRCYIVLLVTYAIFTALMLYTPKWVFVPLETLVSAAILFLSFFFAPIENKNKKLAEKEKLFYKKVSLVVAGIESLIILAGISLFPDHELFYAFTLGALSVVLSMIAALIKNWAAQN